MLFQKRIDRVFKHREEQNKGRKESGDDELRLSDIMEKGDLPAMIIAALITIVPVALLVLLLMGLAGWLFMT